MALIPTSIVLYTAQTPDGIKVPMLLEELGLDYEIRLVNVFKLEQKEDWYLEINPNGRIPALTDVLPDGTHMKLFESGSIMQYLVDRYDTDHKISYPKGTAEHYRTASWLFFQTSGVGPMQGQAMHFTRFAPETFEYGQFRYRTETNRLYRVLDTALAQNSARNEGYLVGDRCTMADLALWPWVVADFWAGVDGSVYPHLVAWEKRMAARPGVDQGRHRPGKHMMKEMGKDRSIQERVERTGGAWIRSLQDANAKAIPTAVPTMAMAASASVPATAST